MLYLCLSPLIALLQRTLPQSPAFPSPQSSPAPRAVCRLPLSPAWQKRHPSCCECHIVGGPPSPHPSCSSALCFYQACLSWDSGLSPARGAPQKPPCRQQQHLGVGGIAACPRLVIQTSESSAHGSEQLAYLTLSLPWWLGC